MSIPESIFVNPNFKVFMNNLFYPYNTRHTNSETWFLKPTYLSSLILSLAAVMLVVVKLNDSKISLNWKDWSSNKKRKNPKIVQANMLLPIRLPLIDELYSMIKLQRDGIKELERWREKFGKLFRVAFGPMHITCVTDPDIIQKILSSSLPQHLNRPRIYTKFFGDCFHDGIVTSDYDVWIIHRKMLSRSFTYKSLQNYLVFMNTQAKNLAKSLILESENNEKQSVERGRLNQLMYSYAFKIIAQIVMGSDNLSHKESEQLANNSNRFKDLITERVLNPLSYEHYFWLHPKKMEYDRLNAYLNNVMDMLTEMYKKQAEQVKKDSQITKNKHSHGEQVPSNGIGHDDVDDDDDCVGVKPFRCMIEEMLSCGASDKEIHAEVGTILGTGHETTVMAIRMLLLHLALNPEVQARCKEEVDGVIKKKMCENNVDEFSCELSMDDLQNMKYLERCIMESGRISSTVPIFLRRLDAPLKINDDLEFPTGTNFGIPPWLVHKDPEQFPNPEKFDPDRFLPENVKKRHSYAYIPFSMGPRNCIGWKVSIMQTKVMMAWIIRHFEIFSTDKLEDVKMLFAITIVPEREYNITLERRIPAQN